MENEGLSFIQELIQKQQNKYAQENESPSTDFMAGDCQC
jgi:hypothetical protein